MERTEKVPLKKDISPEDGITRHQPRKMEGDCSEQREYRCKGPAKRTSLACSRDRKQTTQAKCPEEEETMGMRSERQAR